jgi:hypothetical protein
MSGRRIRERERPRPRIELAASQFDPGDLLRCDADADADADADEGGSGVTESTESVGRGGNASIAPGGEQRVSMFRKDSEEEGLAGTTVTTEGERARGISAVSAVSALPSSTVERDTSDLDRTDSLIVNTLVEGTSTVAWWAGWSFDPDPSGTSSGCDRCRFHIAEKDRDIFRTREVPSVGLRRVEVSSLTGKVPSAAPGGVGWRVMGSKWIAISGR